MSYSEEQPLRCDLLKVSLQDPPICPQTWTGKSEGEAQLCLPTGSGAESAPPTLCQNFQVLEEKGVLPRGTGCPGLGGRATATAGGAATPARCLPALLGAERQRQKLGAWPEVRLRPEGSTGLGLALPGRNAHLSRASWPPSPLSLAAGVRRGSARNLEPSWRSDFDERVPRGLLSPSPGEIGTCPGRVGLQARSPWQLGCGEPAPETWSKDFDQEVARGL